MNEEDLITSYLLEYNKITAKAKRLNLTDQEIEKCFKESFTTLSNNQSQKPKSRLITKLAFSFSLILLTIYVLLYVHQPTSSLVLRNVQSFIYPGFKVVRHLSMPIITLFPSLTALYDESCLIENPYFQVSNLECYPCENVHSVINLTGLTNQTLYETGTPFIIHDNNQKHIRHEDVINMYSGYADMFDANAQNVKSNNASIANIKDIMIRGSIDKGTHVSWRINRMEPARILRKLFPRPSFMSEWSGQSIERFVLIDGEASDGYLLPGFECSYVFLIQGHGERNIILKPTTECKGNCRTISIGMKPSHILWYNWWYWKPLSLPAENSTNISISYISSYC